MADANTVLTIVGADVPPYAGRGLTQTLEPITPDAVQLRRTVNGQLVSLVPPQFRKYKSKISGNDQESPALDGIYIGQVLQIDCIVELAIPGGAGPDRPVVPGSERVVGDFGYYRPQLIMLVTGFSIEDHEWENQVSWTLELEEI